MSGTTPVYGLPYQELDDPPDGPNLGYQLALAVEAELARIDAAAAALAARRTFVRKTTDGPAAANNTSLQSDPELIAALAANSTYTFDVLAFYVTHPSADINFAFTFPSGAVCAWAPAGLKYDGSNYEAWFSTATWRAASGTANALAGDGASYNTTRLKGVIRTGATAGNLTLRWAQKAAHASGTVLKADSYLVLNKEA